MKVVDVSATGNTMSDLPNTGNLGALVRSIFPEATYTQIEQLRHDLYAMHGIDAFRVDGRLPVIQQGKIDVAGVTWFGPTAGAVFYEVKTIPRDQQAPANDPTR